MRVKMRKARIPIRATSATEPTVVPAINAALLPLEDVVASEEGLVANRTGYGNYVLRVTTTTVVAGPADED